jgi:hypothetical protein
METFRQKRNIAKSLPLVFFFIALNGNFLSIIKVQKKILFNMIRQNKMYKTLSFLSNFLIRL